MINEQDQQLLLNLLLASIIYINVATEKPNPFVKHMGVTMNKKALEILIKATNDLQHLLPLLSEIEGVKIEDFGQKSITETEEEVNLDDFL